MKAFVMREIGQVGFMHRHWAVPWRPAADGAAAEDPGDGRVDPTLMTTHRFAFDQMHRAFEASDKKLDHVIKPLITFS